MTLSAPLLHRLFLLLAALCILPVLLSLLLLTQAQTLAARLVALIFPLFWLSAITLENCWHRGWFPGPRRRLFLLALGAALLLLVFLLVWIYRLTPDGRPLPGAAATQVYLNGGGYHRLSPANLVPEVDQFNFGLALLDRMGGFFPGEDSRRIRRLFQAVYHEMDRDPGFRALGSNMNYVYREWFGFPFDCGHAYVYIPALPAARSSTAPASKLPVLLFLHGSLGNFKGYTWVLKELADRHPCAVVSASFGNGNWNRPGGAEAVERVRRWIAAQPQLDANCIYLAGLSNGGRGMLRAALKTPQAYRGLISISGVLEDDLVQSGAFEAGWSGRPVLVLQGEKDARVLPEAVNHAVGIMSLHGGRVTHHTWPDEDHFLLFSARHEIVALLDQWMK